MGVRGSGMHVAGRQRGMSTCSVPVSLSALDICLVFMKCLEIVTQAAGRLRRLPRETVDVSWPNQAGPSRPTTP